MKQVTLNFDDSEYARIEALAKKDGLKIAGYCHRAASVSDIKRKIRRERDFLRDLVSFLFSESN